MLISMTGFGRQSLTIESGIYTITVKTLNSKQTDIYTRLPQNLKDHDIDLRNLLIEHLVRGKIELIIEHEPNTEQETPVFNVPLIRQYFAQLEQIASQYGINPSSELLSVVLRLPNAIQAEQDELTMAGYQKIRTTVGEVLKEVSMHRKKEGEALEADIRDKVTSVLSLLHQITPLEKQRIDNIRMRINRLISEYTSPSDYDKDRFEQELIYYLEKMDITEEKVRLASHCNYFIETMDNDTCAGKKLGFIAQEMTREINTIGSKANDFNIQSIVVQMKDEVEKIKEQLMNIL